MRRARTLALALCAVPAFARAQGVDRPVVRGTVTDDAGRPVTEALVEGDDGTTTRSDADGRFVLAVRRCGDPVRVTVRRVGSVGQQRTMTPCTPGGEARFALAPLATRLGTVAVAAAVIGVTGQVVDRQLQPIAGAEVRLAGTGRTVTTDTAGRWQAFGLDTGTVLVRVAHPRYDAVQLPVTLAPGDVREVVSLLDPRDARRSPRDLAADERALGHFDDRRTIRGPYRAILVRPQLLAADDGRNVLSCALAHVPIARQVVPSLRVAGCDAHAGSCVLLDGRLLPTFQPLNLLRTDEVELVELYGARLEPVQLRGFGARQCAGRDTFVVWSR